MDERETIKEVLNGSLEAKDKVAGVIGLGGYGDEAEDALTLNINSCTNNAVVTATNTQKYNRAAGILAGTGHASTLVIEHCQNTAAITANDVRTGSTIGHAAGIVGSAIAHDITLTNCSNTGTITAGQTAGLSLDPEYPTANNPDYTIDN